MNERDRPSGSQQANSVLPKTIWDPPKGLWDPPKGIQDPPKGPLDRPKGIWDQPKFPFSDPGPIDGPVRPFGAGTQPAVQRTAAQSGEQQSLPPKSVWDPPKGPLDPPKGAWDPPKGPLDPPKGVWDPPKGLWDPPKGIQDPPKGPLDPPKGVWDPPKQSFSDPVPMGGQMDPTRGGQAANLGPAASGPFVLQTPHHTTAWVGDEDEDRWGASDEARIQSYEVALNRSKRYLDGVERHLESVREHHEQLREEYERMTEAHEEGRSARERPSDGSGDGGQSDTDGESDQEE